MAKYTYEDILTLKDLLMGKITPFSVLDKKGWFFHAMPRDLDANVLYRMSSPRYLIRVMYGEKPFQAVENEWFEYFLPKKEAMTTVPVFKVGDRVRIKKEWEGWGADCAPTVGKIGYIYRFHYTQPELVLVGFRDDENCWFYDLDALELVGEADEKSYEERQAEWVKENNLKPGDKVKILRRFERGECGVPFGFDDIVMTDLIGEICEVYEIIDGAIGVYDKTRSNFRCWPYFCLKKIEYEYVPFDLSNEKDRARLRGSWVRMKTFLEREEPILCITERAVYVSFERAGISPEVLLSLYEFVDGTPCGKLVEVNND